MIIELLLLAIVLIILCSFNICCYRSIKKTGNVAERVFLLTVLTIINIFVVVYCLDRFNIPSNLKMNTNVDTQNWLMIITTFISSIISATIGGLIAFGVAREQIKQNNDNNKENNRIQNMPLLKYDIVTNTAGNDDLENLIVSNIDSKHSRVFNIKIKVQNIGLNSVKQVKMDFAADFVSKKIRILGNETHNPIEKDGNIELFKYFRLDNDSCYNIELIVYYEDVLQNWYKQVININCETSPKIQLPKLNISYKTSEEKMISFEEIQ